MLSDREQNIFYSRTERFLLASRKTFTWFLYENKSIITEILYYFSS